MFEIISMLFIFLDLNLYVDHRFSKGIFAFVVMMLI